MISQRSAKRKPTHPGAILREDVLPELSITQQKLADCLNLSRYTVAEILHERKAITPDMALRLAHFLGTTPECWLNMQRTLDLWSLKQNKMRIYKNIKKFT